MKANVLILFISLSLASYGVFAMGHSYKMPNKIPSKFLVKKEKPHKNFYGKGPILNNSFTPSNRQNKNIIDKITTKAFGLRRNNYIVK